MLNTEDFIKRLEFIMEHFGESASSFADKINVQRSSISHLLSGRNKPSLDFVMKIMSLFPELNLYWILDGTGSFLRNEVEESNSNNTEKETTPPTEIEIEKVLELTSSVDDSKMKRSVDFAESDLQMKNSADKSIFKIVFFYNDGTFSSFEPSTLK